MRFISLCTLVVAATVWAGCGGSPSPSPDAPTGDDYAERMATEHADDVATPSPAGEPAPAVAVEGGTVTYAEVNGTPVEGYLVRPAEGGEGAPGIVVIQEWWGLNEGIRAMADRLAGEGYVALAVDLYGGEVAADRDRAMELMQAAMADEVAAEENLRQAWAYLVNEAGASRVGTIGWCFGGGWSLRTALLEPSTAATVIYYGQVITDPAVLADLQTPILGHFGSLDQGIPIDSVEAFEKALAGLGKPATIHVYDGANHAFANPTGTNYEPAAAEEAWGLTLAFFDEHLRGGEGNEPTTGE